MQNQAIPKVQDLTRISLSSTSNKITIPGPKRENPTPAISSKFVVGKQTSLNQGKSQGLAGGASAEALAGTAHQIGQKRTFQPSQDQEYQDDEFTPNENGISTNQLIEEEFHSNEENSMSHNVTSAAAPSGKISIAITNQQPCRKSGRNKR